MSGVLFSSAGSFSGTGGLSNNLGSDLSNPDLTGNYVPILADEMYLVTDPAMAWMWTADLQVAGLQTINRVLIADMSVPFVGFNTEPRFKQGITYNFPKFQNLGGNLQITFHETEDFQVISFISAWMGLVVDSNGYYQLPINYMGVITATLFDTSGIPAFQCDIQCVWPERITDWQLSYNSQLLQTSVMFAAATTSITYVSQNLLDQPIANIINPLSGASSASAIGLGAAAVGLGASAGMAAINLL